MDHQLLGLSDEVILAIDRDREMPETLGRSCSFARIESAFEVSDCAESNAESLFKDVDTLLQFGRPGVLTTFLEDWTWAEGWLQNHDVMVRYALSDLCRERYAEIDAYLNREPAVGVGWERLGPAIVWLREFFTNVHRANHGMMWVGWW